MILKAFFFFGQLKNFSSEQVGGMAAVFALRSFLGL